MRARDPITAGPSRWNAPRVSPDGSAIEGHARDHWRRVGFGHHARSAWTINYSLAGSEPAEPYSLSTSR